MTNIEQFTQQLMLAHDIDYWEAKKRADEFYKMLESETPPVLNDGWISVDDQLPENDDTVLVYYEEDYGFDSLPFWGGITHWQLLPKPPKER